jgi:U3 small nucleolar RNA-associated protein 3
MKKARKEGRAVPDALPPLPDPAAEGARKISAAIEKNRGLTPHRAKAGKNPRKKNRTKFEKAQVRCHRTCTASAAMRHPRDSV